MKRVLLLTTIGLLSFATAFGQPNVFDPSDPIVNYNSSAPSGSAENPAINWGNIQKWVVKPRFTWDGNNYKAYHFNGMSFRVMFPKTYAHNVADGKKYPVMVFFHGAGESGTIYDNELQLLHGGELFMNRVLSGDFDGFLIYPQNQSGAFSNGHYATIVQILDSMAKYVKLDIDRVLVDGLSAGGSACFEITAGYPSRVTKAAITSAAATGLIPAIPNYVHVPIWMATGGLDTNPDPVVAQQYRDAFANAGGNIRWTLYPTMGHFVWYPHWNEPDFVPYMNDLHKANPLVYFGRDKFCPDSPVNARLGITAGFAEYEWSKNDTVIAGAISNEYYATAFGTYKVRFRRVAGGVWSEWSPNPAVISAKGTTITPAIQVKGLRSKVLPAPDGSTTVPLLEPRGYEKYEWFRASDNALLGTDSIFNTGTGVYKARVKEFFGCNAFFSNNFTVVDANGPNKPDAAKNLSVFVLSQTSLQLEWSDNPNPAFNETNFEVYRSATAGGPYQLVAITAPDVLSYIDQSLTANTTYYYIVRAVNNTGAAANSNEASGKTNVDNIPPSTPGNLRVIAINRYSVHLQWDASADNIQLNKYDVYVNGSKLYTTDKTLFVVNGLDALQTYNFTVRARDIAGNSSPPSNQATAFTKMQGLVYYYYQGSWDALPDFTQLPILAIGTSAAPDISVRNQNDNFGFLWQGHIKVPKTGTYRFETCSDDGSALYFNQYYGPSAKRFIDNDGLQGTTCVTKDTALTAGSIYPLALTYFERNSSEVMQFYWTITNVPSPGTNTTRELIPASAFTESGVPVGTVPNAPSSVKAVASGYDRITLNWTDNSNNETGFEISRSVSQTGPFLNIFTTGPNVQSMIDSGLAANTVYYYRVKAINATGESMAAGNFIEANWKVNNNLNDAKGNVSRSLTGNNTSFNNTDKKEGTHSLSFNGTSSYATINNSSNGFPGEGNYTQRTVALWIKPNSTNNKRFIFDFGSSNNGLGLRFNNSGSALQAGVASGGTRTNISLNNVTSNVNWISGGWNHVAVVLNGNSLKLFLNGAEVAANNSLSTNGVASSTGNQSRFGYASGTNNNDNVFNDGAGPNDFFNGLMDDIHVLNGALNAADMVDLMNSAFVESADTTLDIPAVPAAPSALQASAVSPSTVNLQWNDNSNDESAFQVWRSTGNALNYRLIATVDGASGATKSFSDNSLFANVTYYYQVRAVGIGGYSAYSNAANARTLNTKPVLTDIRDFTMRYRTTDTLELSALDADGDVLTFTYTSLPSFAKFQNLSNGNAIMIFKPGVFNQGVYTFTIYISDGNGGKDTTHFSLLVNENYPPTLNPVNNLTMDEGGDTTFNLIANDIESPSYMVWTFTGLPSFATFTNNGNGNSSLRLLPGYAHSGVYNINVLVNDGFGAWTSRSFTLTVNEKDPNEKILVNLQNPYQTLAPAPWNNMGTQSVSALKNTFGATTTVGATMVNGWQFNIASLGAQTGNNSGVYPDVVMRDYLFWGFFYGNNTGDTSDMRITGLNPAKKYNFTFFSGSTYNNAGNNTTYKTGGQSVTLDALNNTSHTVSINLVSPDPAGVVTITMIGDPDPGKGGFLNAFEIASQYEDGTKPARPTSLTGEFVEHTGSVLNWTDVAYNEVTYNVYRSTSKSGPYSLLNPGAGNANTNTYTDGTALPLTRFYYYLVASNAAGDSDHSDTISIMTGNNSPVINNLNDVFVKVNGSVNEDFSVSDNAGDVVTVSSPDMPSFAALQNLGGGNYRIAINPGNNDEGLTTITIVATDNKGGSVSQNFVLHVADRNTRSFYLNFGDGDKTAPAPWNNLVGLLYGGRVDNNLKDETGTISSVAFNNQSGWSGIHNFGHITGNNSGIVPDAVLVSGNILVDNTPRQMSFTGLDNSKKYNVVFIGSGNDGVPAMADLVSAGVPSTTLNTRYNTNQSAQLNGLTPVGGTITFTFSKQATSKYAYLNAIVLEEYTDTFSLSLINPVNLYAEPKDKNSVLLIWADRSNAEDGYEILRGSSAGSLSVINTTAANVSSYIDATAQPGIKYYYAVRAKKNIPLLYSGNSNVVATITPKTVVYINLTFTYPDGLPWNNTNVNPDAFQVFPNLVTDQNVNSGISMEITRGFNGQFYAGMETYGAGGIFPNNVMKSNYWLDKTQLGQFKLSGLNHSKRYRIGFFGSTGPFWSSDEFRDYRSTYTIGNRTVHLNAHYNDSKVVYIGDVVPDPNGEVFLNISSPVTTEYSFTGAIIVQSYDDATGGVVQNGINGNEVTEGNLQNADKNTSTVSHIPGRPQLTRVNAYPNPFTDNISIEFYNDVTGNKVSADIYDITGRLVFRRNAGVAVAGMNTLRLNIENSGFSPGIYLVKLNINGQAVSTTKLIKSRK